MQVLWKKQALQKSFLELVSGTRNSSTAISEPVLNVKWPRLTEGFVFRAAEHKLMVIMQDLQSAHIKHGRDHTNDSCPTTWNPQGPTRIKPYRQPSTLGPNTENGWKNLGWQDHKAAMVLEVLEPHSLQLERLLRDKRLLCQYCVSGVMETYFSACIVFDSASDSQSP